MPFLISLPVIGIQQSLGPVFVDSFRDCHYACADFPRRDPDEV